MLIIIFLSIIVFPIRCVASEEMEKQEQGKAGLVGWLMIMENKEQFAFAVTPDVFSY